MRAQNCWFLPSHTIALPCVTPLDDQISMFSPSVSRLSRFPCYFHVTYSLAMKGNGREGMFKAMRGSPLMDPDGYALPLGLWLCFWTSVLDAASPATWIWWEWLEKESRWRGAGSRTGSQDGAAVLYMCWTRQPRRQNLYDVSRLMDTADRQQRI